ncbi:MAG: hypothetical protein WDZ30_07655 [Cellvibrionaceae bacterium]
MRYLLLFFLALCLTSCTPPRESYVIGNVSGENLTVSFAMQITEHFESPCYITDWMPPRVTTDAISRFGSVAFSDLPGSQFDFDSENCSIEILVQPEEFVSISGPTLYSEHYEKLTPEWVNPNLLYLKLESPQGTVEFTGLEIPKKFKKKKGRYYVYSYR